MRAVIASVLLVMLGCSQLRYAPRTEMVAIAADPNAPPPPRSPAARSSRPGALGRHWRALVAVGTLTLIGSIVPLVVASVQRADPECTWLCAPLDDAMIATGAVYTVGGMVLLGAGLWGHREAR